MATRYNTLVFGASYGSLLATKLVLAGHDVCLICLPEEVDLINREGTRTRIPIRGRAEPVLIDSREAPGRLSAAGPTEVGLDGFDLVALAMQEPQYRAPGVRELLDAVGRAEMPCMSIMNMPPLPYLARIPGLDTRPLSACYTDPGVWQNVKPSAITLASPDPQAFRPPDEPSNVLQVSLPTNFKVARFESDEHTAVLRAMQSDIEAIRHEVDGEALELPVKLKVHDSVFVPLAKWSMLLTGNYRCVGEHEMLSIRDAVHGDLEASRGIYEWVSALARKLGAAPADQVPFEKYANAADGLVKPSSAARALFAGAPNIERVDCVVRTLAATHGLQHDVIDAIVQRVDARLAGNRGSS